MNLETGEIIRQIYEGETVIVKQKYRGKEEADAFFFNPSTEFIKLWDCIVPALTDIKLSGAEMAVLLCMAAHTEYDSFVVVHPSGRHLNSTDLMAETSLSENTVKSAVLKLKDKSLIAISLFGKAYTYIMNPYVFGKGHDCNSTLARMFQNTPIKIIYDANRRIQVPEDTEKISFGKNANFVKLWVRALNRIANIRLSGADYAALFIMMHKARYDTGAIMHDNGKALTQLQLATLCGVTPRKLRDSIAVLKKHGIVAEKDNTLYINPFVAARGEKVNQELIDLFPDNVYRED